MASRGTSLAAAPCILLADLTWRRNLGDRFAPSKAINYRTPFQGELHGRRIVRDFGCRVEAHRRPPGNIVFGPATIAVAGESHPDFVHHYVRERLRRVSPEERLGSEAQRIEDERYLHAMGRPQAGW